MNTQDRSEHFKKILSFSLVSDLRINKQLLMQSCLQHHFEFVLKILNRHIYLFDKLMYYGYLISIQINVIKIENI
ncbi:hypothetical protein BpHYR1_038805 [Brachionus plicatilis]|uniref:Uncharacterized protein n=1 Tax=Brachionus plicatilis TaxID=10195 RepID=A0A3M7QAL0_BRAPC|nr:hypothetical protein BpHYR1_038805 [Brachionus plicatilis]